MQTADLAALVATPGGELEPEKYLRTFPALERAKSTPQDPVYHGEGDVWTHTLMVLAALIHSEAYASASADERLVLFLAALLHDVAKADTTRIDPVSGRISQPGHSPRGAIDTRVLLWKAGLPFAQREAVCRLIAVHQLPFYLLSDARHDPARQVRRLSWALDTRLLAALATADMQGRICADKARVLDEIALFQALCEEEGAWGQARSVADAHTRLNYARHGIGHPDVQLYQEAGSRVTMLCGLPASGKNTWVEMHCPDLAVVSFDDAKAELGLRHGQNDGAAAHYAIDKARDLLRRKQAFVWNATHLSTQMRDKTLELLYRYQAEVRIVYLEQGHKELLRRNAKRDSTLRQRDLERMLHRWEVPLPWEAHQVDYLVGEERPTGKA
ncbi:AAA family ATPase [Chitinimonas sp.]|uniref:AAA family ATPase n=1 Tax=Chitinimonas sp. TaxID=1934313 RepID=UPI0035B38139